MKEKTFPIHPLTRLLAAAMTLALVLAAVTPLGAYASDDSCTHEWVATYTTVHHDEVEEVGHYELPKGVSAFEGGYRVDVTMAPNGILLYGETDISYVGEAGKYYTKVGETMYAVCRHCSYAESVDELVAWGQENITLNGEPWTGTDPGTPFAIKHAIDCGYGWTYLKVPDVEEVEMVYVVDTEYQAAYDEEVLTYVCAKCGATQSADEYEAHTWDDGAITTAATCTEDGVKTYTCSTCGDTYIETIPATGHTVVTDAAVEVTCTQDGLTEGSHCSACGEVFTAQETIPATGHTVVTDAAVEATCTEDGLTEGSHCSVCNEVMVAQEVIPATGHSYDDGVVTTEATCTEDGEITYTCTVCGDTYTEAIPATGHDYDLDGVVTAEPTCTEDGAITYTCTVCGETYVEAIPATGHSYGKGVITMDATCTTDGVRTYTCAACGDSYIEVIPATGHSFEYGNVTTEPTCTEDGEMTYTCINCGVYNITEVIPATGHTEGEAVVENEVAATCTEDGSYDSVVYCTVCGAELSRETVTVPATGHSYNDGVVTTEPTCTEEGVKTYTCTVCGDTYTEAVPATGHSYDDGVVTTEATCTEEGVMTYTCTVCGATKTEAIPATGHTEGEAVMENEIAATCTENGSYDSVVYCTVCGAELSRETVTVPATGHDFSGEWQSNENGHWLVCANCGELAELGLHTYGDWVVTQDATSTEDGAREKTCTVCGHTVTETIAATGTSDSGTTDDSSSSSTSDSSSSSSTTSDSTSSTDSDSTTTSSTVKTGDETSLILWIVLLLAACGGLAVTVTCLRRKQK